jgi:hypothetical protein
MEGIVELNDQITFYLIVILVFISWMLSTIVYSFSSANNKIKYKYENHGTFIECLCFTSLNRIRPPYGADFFNNAVVVVFKAYSSAYSGSSDLSSTIFDAPLNKPVRFYENADKGPKTRPKGLLKQTTLNQSEGKSSIYKWSHWVPVDNTTLLVALG